MVDGSNTDSLVDRKNSDPLGSESMSGSESIQYSIQDRCVLYRTLLCNGADIMCTDCVSEFSASKS